MRAALTIRGGETSHTGSSRRMEVCIALSLVLASFAILFSHRAHNLLLVVTPAIGDLASQLIVTSHKMKPRHEKHYEAQPPHNQQQQHLQQQWAGYTGSQQTLHYSQHQSQIEQLQQLQQQQHQHQQQLQLQQQLQQQIQQQQLYNMNSDYSSSNYHVYDQINDLIIIKQQRMERKRQVKHRRKVIFLTLIATFLVGSLVFILLQWMMSPVQTSGQPMAQPVDPIQADPTPKLGYWVPPTYPSLPRYPPSVQRAQPNQNTIPITFKPPIITQAPIELAQPPSSRSSKPMWSPPTVRLPNEPETVSVPSKVILLPGNLAGQRQADQQQADITCSGHGTVISSSEPSNQAGGAPMCKCDLGHYGERCELTSAPYQPPSNSLLARCLLTNCNGNGQCNSLGRCQCSPGFVGPHCEFRVPQIVATPAPACSNQCSGRGQCVRSTEAEVGQPEWRCLCQLGATGDDCGISLELQCDDGIDNDRDGLIDCADSECCGDKSCSNSTLCMKSPDPIDILMRKQPPPPTSSFFQRMQFLVEKFSSQIYTNPKDFNDSLMTSKNVNRASVIRGRVTYMRQGVTGVKVSVADQINLGFTLTRDGGHFDLMVNGGGAVVLEFRREPFANQRKAVRVPWNEIILMDSVELALETASGPSFRPSTGHLANADAPVCSAHNYRQMRPHIVAAQRSSRILQSGSSRANLFPDYSQTSRAVILRDSGMVQQSIVLPASHSNQLDSNQSVSIVYISSRANEFMSTINVQLTQPASEHFKLPQELKSIHLKIVIEGNLFEQVFEPQTNLSFTYAWNRRNVYRQKSFGLSTASVSVGHEYHDCKQIIWSTKHVQLAGHDLSISDIGSQWNLNIHHRYNYRDSILQRGDGQNYNLKTDRPRVVQPLMGDGYQRQAVCPFCDGSSSLTEQRLYKPQAIVSAPDGSLYVGDYNLIRRLEPATSASFFSPRQVANERMVRTVLELPTSRVPSRYTLALNPIEQKLYMSDQDRHQIYLVRDLQGRSLEVMAGSNQLNESSSAEALLSAGMEENLTVVAGSGVKCHVGDKSNCGDGHSAKSARLLEPRAIAFDLNNRLHIADGPNVRMVDTDGKIYTILGDYGGTRHTKFPCNGEAQPMHKFFPREPVDIAFSPLDDTLHILDDNVVYKITQDKRVQVVAGRLPHCLLQPNENPAELQSKRNYKASEVLLQSTQSIAFNQNGDLFISEDDQKQISRVLLVSPEEDTITLFAGQQLDPSTPAQSLRSGISPTVDSLHLEADVESQQVDGQQPRSSNIVPLSQTTRAADYKFSSIAAMTVDQQGNLIVADRSQLRLLSVEPDLPQINAAGEYELQSPDNRDELLVFNRHGHHIATRELTSGQAQRNPNKYTFTYSVNTSFGQLASVNYATGNKISIYRDGPQHSARMIETAYGGQCRLDVTRSGQVQLISTVAPNATKTSFAYHSDGGLLKQSRDQASGEIYEFTYDEHGRALAIQHSSPKSGPVECRVGAKQARSAFMGQLCASLILDE